MRKSSGPIVRRYATTLFELSSEAKDLQDTAAQVRALQQLLTPELVTFFKSPRHSAESKAEVLEVLVQGLKASPTMAGFLRLLMANGRLEVLPGIVAEFLLRADAHFGISRVTLSTARPLSSAELGEFEAALSQSLQKKLVLSTEVDESLLAGVLVRIGNTLVDASLKAKLMNLKESLTQGV